jgi:macrolide-specific efflux system membrane fusion protein
MTVSFSESDIDKVHVGQAATVTFDALSTVELAAHVTSIATVGTVSSSVVSYDATLPLDQTDARVKPEMSATATVTVAQTSGVNIPNSAVSGEAGLGTVTVEQNGSRHQQQVVIGLKGDSRTQIVSGLASGDQIVVTTTLPALGANSTSGAATPSLSLSGGGRGTGGFGGGGGSFPGGPPSGGAFP